MSNETKRYLTTSKPLAVQINTGSPRRPWVDNSDLSPSDPGPEWELLHVNVTPEAGTRDGADHRCGWIYWTWKRSL